MSRVSNNGSPFSTNSTNQAANSTNASSAINDVNLDDFLELMIAELQNQDPLNPLENDQLVAQIGQIRQVGATDKLTATLDAVLLGQNISSATSLIGSQVNAISDDNQKVSGIVERVSVSGGDPKLHLDLKPRASASGKAGEIEKGAYEYRVAWREDGKLFAIDPLADLPNKSISLNGESGVDQAVEITNLPKTIASKQIYRRDAKAGGNFRLVDTLTDGSKSSYIDVKSNSQLSELTLTGTPQFVDSKRTFEVRLKNVSEIRPVE